MTKSTRIQLRGICSVCGKQQATKHGDIVPHGYTIQYGFQSHECQGSHAVHYGHKDAPKFLREHAELVRKEATRLEERTEKEDLKPRELRKLNAQAQMMKNYADAMQERADNWKEQSLIEVDLEVEEASEKARKAAERKAAQEAKQAKDAEKEAKRLQREAKAKQKWDGILSENKHQVEVKGEVVKEWVASYENRNALENAHYDKLKEHLDELGVSDPMDRMGYAYHTTYRVRETAGKGKMLHKF